MIDTNRYTREVTVNPCKMCMPLGAILPFKGIENSMCIIHGSQGCSTYMRRHIAEHFNEPIDVASSSITENGAIYGGAASLKKGLDNLIRLYNPGLIGILTTCLAETIGEDINRIAAEYLKERGIEDYPLITVPTPGYGSTHSEGYFLAVKRIVEQVAVKTREHGRVNIIVPNISPADIREIKRILELMTIEYVMVPDFSETLDSPFNIPYKKIPAGGTGLTAIKEMGGACATIQFASSVEDGISPGKYLESKFGVPLYTLPLPMGIRATDEFLALLVKLTGASVPETLKKERGRLIDGMIDSHKYNFAGRAVIFGEPEIIRAVAGTCRENGILPAVIATGTGGPKVKAMLESEFSLGREGSTLLYDADFEQIRENAREREVNIAIGSSDGRYLTEKEGISLVRHGFPIHDRVGGQRLLSLGYQGTMMFLDRVTNTLLENKNVGYRGDMYRKYYHEPTNTGLSESRGERL